MKKKVSAIAMGASLLLAGAAFAQDVPASRQVPPPPPGEATPPPPPPPGAVPPPPPPPAGAMPPATTQAPDPSMPPPAADAPPPPPPPGASHMPPPPPGGEAGSSGTTMATPQGQVTVNSGPAPAKPVGPAPDFATLAGKKSYITESEASAYPLLANDFQYADANRDGKISKSEYQRWVAKSGAAGQ